MNAGFSLRHKSGVIEAISFQMNPYFFILYVHVDAISRKMIRLMKSQFSENVGPTLKQEGPGSLTRVMEHE